VPLTGVINYVFCIYICCFIANIGHRTRLGSKQSHSHRAYMYIIIVSFLADRTNGRAYATALRLSVICRLSFVVCDVMYCG